MAKKRNLQVEEVQRQSRKEQLRARRQAEQLKRVRLAVAGVVLLLVLVALVGVINETFLVPNQTVATVNDERITLREWQDRVRYERAQRIIFLENQYEAFEGNVGIIQQFAGQSIIDLQPLNAENLGQDVLDLMINEVVIRQAAEARGITVTDEDVDRFIGETFNYFGGESPTPLPTPTETAIPTPSLTPIPTPVITDVVPTETPLPTSTMGPTPTPFPTATPVSQEAFQEQLNRLLEQFRSLGITEAAYRNAVRAQLYQERLMDALADERELATQAEHASVFLLSFGTEESANEALALINDGDFLTVWNTVRSTPVGDSEGVFPDANASELLWRTRDAYESSFGADVAEAIFTLPVNTPSEVLVQNVNEETTRYHILQVSGRELRDLSESALQTEKQQLLRSFIDAELVGNSQITEVWRGRVPTQPLLDPKFLAQPTPTPNIPVPTVAPEVVPTDDGT